MTEGHGGRAVSLALKSLGVRHVFALSGGHIFPIFDGCKADDIRVIDVRHEQSAGYAAEGWARLARSVGVCVVTAGPGVTNIMSPLAQAGFNGASVLALAGRAPEFRWGQGSLQELDHVPFVKPIADAKTVRDSSAIAREVLSAAKESMTPPRRPAFLDFPLEVLFNTGDIEVPPMEVPERVSPDESEVTRVARLIEESERPVVIAGSNVWLDGAEDSLRSLAESAGIPVYMNGQGRGCLPADHELAFSRSRARAMREADVVVVAGTPIDFRLGFGGNFATGAKIVHLEAHPSLLASHVDVAAGIGARLDATLASLAQAVQGSGAFEAWANSLRAIEREKSDGVQGELRSDNRPIHPLRIYGELVPLLDRDAIVVGDGGDFVSFAGREIPSYEPGCWLDPGPFGCLGCGPGYALAARLAYPDRQVVLLLGDGALGFSGMELESMVRHHLPVVCVVGNNGIWGLEKHPMRAMYGYDLAADLQPGIRYDEMMTALGGRGELVTEPEEIGPALKRAFDSGEPTLVNVLTDPEVAYPRSANLA
jgi:acetolactate synthase I/II/III large subunit